MRHASRGFTLLEVLVALALLAGTITTVVVAFNYHLSLVVRDRDETTALLLARAKLDESDFLTVSNSEGTFAPQQPEITWKRQTMPTDYPGLQRYLLTVSWLNGQRSLTLVTYGKK